MKKTLTLTSIGVTDGHDLTGFENYLSQLGRSGKTVTEYSRSVKQYLAYLDSLTGMPSTTAWLNWTVSNQQKRLTGYAVKAYSEFLREFQPDASRNFGIPSRLPAATRPDPKPLDDPEEVVRKLVQIAKKILPRDSYISLRVFVRVLRELATRRSEAGGIGWNDIGWEESSVTIRGKGSKIRRLPVSKKLLRMFTILRARSTVSLWIGGQGQMLNSKGLADLFKKVAKVAGMPGLKCHTFRATRLTEIGNSENFNPLLYQTFSGHSDLGTAKYYVRADLNSMRNMLPRCR